MDILYVITVEDQIVGISDDLSYIEEEIAPGCKHYTITEYAKVQELSSR